MSRKRLTLLLVTAVAVVLTGGIRMAMASSDEISHPTTIRAVGKVIAVGVDEANKNDPSRIANSYTITGSLWNVSQTHRIGRFDVACTITTTNGDFALCDATFTFGHKGEISTSGVSPQTGAPDTDPITGGDGHFRNVRGQVDVGNSNGPTIPFTFELEP